MSKPTRDFVIVSHRVTHGKAGHAYHYYHHYYYISILLVLASLVVGEYRFYRAFVLKAVAHSFSNKYEHHCINNMV